MVHQAPPARRARVRLSEDSNPLLTLAPLWQGPGDPVMRFEGRIVLRATRTSAGPAALRLNIGKGEVLAEAWGPGATLALDGLPSLLGERDDPARLRPQHRLLAELARSFRGVRLTRTGAVLETLVPAIIGQKVTGFEAQRSYRLLVRRFGEPAPGPLGLTLPPAADELARQPYYAFHPLGLERRRADALRAVGRVAQSLERLTDVDPEKARRRLLSLPGIGEWTAAETLRVALGDPDAVSVGDYNLPNLVGWALAGERRADDTRMLELLEPYRGQRARVVLLLELSGRYPARRGPRMAPRSIARI
jgi:3-methyladenine DNA glycosylase/8-oxoguanine DNA glycosylase